MSLMQRVSLQKSDLPIDNERNYNELCENPSSWFTI